MKCAEYFRSQAGYRRCFGELLKKWKSYGRPAGMITLAHASEEERRLLGGILGKTFYDAEIRFSFADFEKGLQRTRFAPVDVKELLESYFGGRILTHQEEREQKQREREAFFARLQEDFSEREGEMAPASRWLGQMKEQKAFGFQLLSRELEKDREAAELLAQNTGRALRLLFSGEEGGEKEKACRETLLAVFSAGISGNPHYFDRGTPGGQLLINAICCVKEQPLPENAHQWKELLLGAGIAPDYISSMVHAYGIRLLTPEGSHPAFEAFRLRREACAATLENLRDTVSAWAPGGRIFAVENEMVFSFLTEQLRLGKEDIGLLCTSGQLRTAAVKLLELFAEEGYQICYSGDMDPEGIDIADRLWRRFGNCVEIWRMSPEDYRRGISEERLSAARLARMEKAEHPVLKRTAAFVKKEGRAAYQENILGDLLADLLEGVS